MQLLETFEHCLVSMIIVDQDGNIRYINEYGERIFQYEKQELLNTNVNKLFEEDNSSPEEDYIYQFVHSLMPKKSSDEKYLYAIRKNGQSFPVEITSNPIDLNGERVVLLIVFEMSERVVADERFKTAFHAAPSGMLMIDSKRNIIICNRKTEEIFGYEKDELIGQKIEVLVPDDFQIPHPKFVENYLKDPIARSMGIGRELFGKHKLGKMVPVEIGLQPVFVGKNTYVISSIVDISIRRHVEEELRRKTEELTEFSYRTSHDLKSPLKTIRVMSDGVAESIKENDIESVIKYNEKIGLLAAKLNDLIESIMNLTKVELTTETKVEFDFKQYELDANLKLESMIQENKVELDFQFYHADSLFVQPTRLIQVLDNLISNSLKYADHKKEKSFVRIKTFSGANLFMINIEDNGLGIPKQKQSEVFGMFKRFHSGQIAGSGLGLYLIKKQIDYMGAKISFKSNELGTTFFIELPIR